MISARTLNRIACAVLALAAMVAAFGVASGEFRAQAELREIEGIRHG